MLLTDSNHVTTADLTRIDGSVASASGATAVLASDAIAQAWVDVSSSILQYMKSLYPGRIYYNQPNFYNTGYRVQLPQIIVTPSIVNWIAWQALYVFFQSALNSKGKSEVYEAKMLQYQQRADETRTQVYNLPLPVVFIPLAAPGAVNVINSGSWAAVAVSGGAGVAPTTAEVTITYQNSVNYSQNNESGGAAPITVSLNVGERVSVSTAGLFTPDGSFGTPVKFGMAATHWNVYCKYLGVSRKVGSGIAVSTTTYVFDPATVAYGVPLGLGQYADNQELFASR